MTRKYKVLFLCRDNSALGIIAEALLRELAGHRFDAFSAGPEPAARIHPLALAQLRRGISGRDLLSPKSWLEFTGEWAPRMDLVIALDESVNAHHVPAFPGAPSLRCWTVANPLGDGLSDDERVRLFDKMFWQIVRQVGAFIALPQYAAPPVRDMGALMAASASAAAPASTGMSTTDNDSPRAADSYASHPAASSASGATFTATLAAETTATQPSVVLSVD
ncbi:low molecular weight phosphatase family protein [Paraburkholderia ribeironis]|uniref:arsenate-mycothiol transferase ArsC n=1 Tax=Paraburkholderia ribeironis TaxID=1247936 RepID=UPI000B9D5211|nr:low molecular weight phosphatase family protein [Paraburkholderia ribeironis]